MESNKGKQLQDWHIAVQYFFVVWVLKYCTGWEPPLVECELGNTSIEKKRFLSGIARMREGGLPMPGFFGPLFLPSNSP